MNENVEITMEKDGVPNKYVLNQQQLLDFVNQLKSLLVIEGPSIPYPEKHILENEVISDTEHLVKGASQPVFILERVEYPEEGGIYVYLKDVLYPTKGFPNPEACQANNIAKRAFVGQLRFLAKNPLAVISLLRKKNFESFLREYCSMAEIALGRFYLKDIRYQISVREIRKFVYKFFKELKIAEDICLSFSKTFATLLEYDNAYLFRVQDLANETDKEKLLLNPVKEFKKLLEILKQRDPRVGMHERFGSATMLISMAFKIPKIRKAYREALQEIDFTKIQMDENDRYQVLRWDKYNFFGESFEVRGQRYMEMHNGHPPQAMVIGG